MSVAAAPSSASALPASARPVSFADLAGWSAAPTAAAFAAFRSGCAQPPTLRKGSEPPPGLEAACRAAAELSPPDDEAARRFFERWFVPHRIEAGARGFLTGYYEPEFPASLTPTPGYEAPLFARPADLVTLEAGASPAGLPPGLQAARRRADGRLEPYPTRRAIDEGGLGAAAAVIAWMRDPVDRFIIQVQGSARLRLPDGRAVRVAYAGRNGHPYTSLGRLLSQRENIPPAELTMDRLVARLKAEPDPNRLIWENQSFVFFRLAPELRPDQGPIGGAGLPLTPGTSIAADRAIWAYGLPMWLSGEIPGVERGMVEPLRRLAIIQDTGSAIVGPARFDLFWGSGDAAGFRAGLTRHPVDAAVLWPRPAPGGP